MLSASEIEQFRESGWLYVPKVFDPERDIRSLREAYEALFEVMLERCCPTREAERSPQMNLGDMLAYLIGSTGGAAFQHLDPALEMLTPGYRWQPDLPSAQLPELFELMRHSRLLDALEGLIGSEIQASPAYHMNLKLSEAHLGQAKQADAQSSTGNLGSDPWFDLNFGVSEWHRDSVAILPTSVDSQIVVAWVPLTEATVETGTLAVLPGSHRDDRERPRSEEDRAANEIAVEANPGDLVFFHHNLKHGSTPNLTADRLRWTINMRYLPIGQSHGRRFIPSFVARSRLHPENELRDPVLWSKLWRNALTHYTRYEAPAGLKVDNLENARKFEKEWFTRVPTVDRWLALENLPLQQRVTKRLQKIWRGRFAS